MYKMHIKTYYKCQNAINENKQNQVNYSSFVIVFQFPSISVILPTGFTVKQKFILILNQKVKLRQGGDRKFSK